VSNKYSLSLWSLNFLGTNYAFTQGTTSSPQLILHTHFHPLFFALGLKMFPLSVLYNL